MVGASSAAPTTAVVPSRILRIDILLTRRAPPGCSLDPTVPPEQDAAPQGVSASRPRAHPGPPGLWGSGTKTGNGAHAPAATYLRHCGREATSPATTPERPRPRR